MMTGSGVVNPLFFIGVIEEIVDPRKEGRVKVRAFNIHGTKDEIDTVDLPWSIVCWGNYDPNYHLHLNDWVFGVFLDGRDAQTPMVLGLIPTQTTKVPEPEKDGYGAYPTSSCENQMGPNEFGQPRNSKTHRGEYLDETFVGEMDQLRVRDIQGAEGTDSWSEPPPFARPEYPYNRTIETAKHRIEIDDSDGAERITVHHRSGSYIEIGSRGTTKHKSIHDKFEINDENQYVYVGGTSNVVIKGNAYVKVEGNKTEEIMGNLSQLIHGNHHMSVGGESSINAANAANIRGASVKIHANANDISMMAEENIITEAKDTASVRAPMIWNDASINWAVDGGTGYIKTLLGLHMKSTGFTNIDSEATLDLSSASTRLKGTTTLDLTSTSTRVEGTATIDVKGAITKIGGGTTTHIRGTTVNIDDTISMANGSAVAPSAALSAAPAINIPSNLFQPGVDQERGIPQLPEPVPYSAPPNFPDRPPLEEVGVLASDHESDAPPETEAQYYVSEGAFSTGEKYWLIIDRNTGIRAQPESGVNTLYRSEESAIATAERLNEGGTGF